MKERLEIMKSAETDTKDWKKEIFALDDPKVLNYIQELCSARLQVGRAEKRLSEKPAKNDTYAEPTLKMEPEGPLPCMFEDDPEQTV